jgi:hypothetical protein
LESAITYFAFPVYKSLLRDISTTNTVVNLAFKAQQQNLDTIGPTT